MDLKNDLPTLKTIVSDNNKNGVWLTSNVPIKYLYLPEADKREFEGFYHVIHPVPE